MPFTTFSHGNVSWTSIVYPDQHDIDQLAALYLRFQSLNLIDCLTLLEIPKLDHSNSDLCIVIHMPLTDTSEQAVKIEQGASPLLY
jgi:hypothetical protein